MTTDEFLICLRNAFTVLDTHGGIGVMDIGSYSRFTAACWNWILFLSSHR
jgi:23S rRNA A2030 N6-methylase RlmJ